MKKHGILNSDIAKILADLGHTDKIVIGDAGLPIPEGVKRSIYPYACTSLPFRLFWSC